MKHTVEKIELAGGTFGLLIKIPTASVTNFYFSFRAGDYLSPKDKWDTAHLMEHLVLGANKKFRVPANYFKEFTKNGAYCNASTGDYDMAYEAECADFETERILDLLCLAIEAPLFGNLTYLAEKSNVKEELRSLDNDHFSKLSIGLARAMGFHDLNFAEREQQLKNIDLEDIKNHYKKTHTSSNLRFIVAGPIQKYKPAIIKRIKQLDLKVGNGRIDLVGDNLISLAKPLVQKNTAVNNIYYRWETVLDHALKPQEEYTWATLYGTLLGTLHSRIFGTARERGLVYGINYGKFRTKNNDTWWIGGQVLPENIEALFKLMAKELRAVARGQFSLQELKEAKQFVLGDFHRSVQTVGQLLSGYCNRLVFDDEVDEYDKVPERVKAITCQQIIKTARLSLDAKNPWGVGFYGATNKIDPDSLQKILGSAYIKQPK
jgi:predicted Zn-dependent peptidase